MKKHIIISCLAKLAYVSNKTCVRMYVKPDTGVNLATYLCSSTRTRMETCAHTHAAKIKSKTNINYTTCSGAAKEPEPKTKTV